LPPWRGVSLNSTGFAPNAQTALCGPRRRLKTALSVQEAAAIARVPPTTWYRWEKSEGLPLDALPAIAAAVGCTPADLVGGKMAGQKARKK